MLAVAKCMEIAQVPDRVVARLALTGAVLAVGVMWSSTPSRGDPTYFLLDRLIATGLGAQEGKELRVNGFVQAGSIEPLYGNAAHHRFTLVRRGVALRVHTRGALPDTFKDQAEVIVTGRVVHDDDWRLDGTAVIARCPTKYEGPPDRQDNIAFE